MSLIFTPYDREAIQKTLPFFRTQTDRFCDWTVGGTYMWRDFFACRYAIVGDCLLIEAKYIDEQIYFSYPLGNGNKEQALSALEDYCTAIGVPLQFATVSPTDTATLLQRYGDAARVIPQPMFYDYLYHYTDLATFAGRRYSGQRNHINQFVKRWPNWQYADLTPAMLPKVLSFLDNMEKEKTADEPLSPMEQADIDGSRDMLAIMHDCGMTGGCILVDGEIAAFSVGEILGDTLYVHIEKGDNRYGGVYQMIVREYAAHTATDGVQYINREDDSGDPGLRQSKLAYRPCAILEKNLVIIDR